MVIRNAIKCISCDTITLTKTTVGHSDKQKHSFPCPGCGVVICFVLHLDQKNAGWEFDDKVENGEWCPDVFESEHVRRFDSELLKPRGVDGFSPFMATLRNYIDFAKFQNDEAIRRHARENHWRKIQILFTHFENSNWKLFIKEAQKIDNNYNDKTKIACLFFLHNIFMRFIENFVFKHEVIIPKVFSQIESAVTSHKDKISDFSAVLRKSGRLYYLWQQLNDIYSKFMLIFPSVSPVLQFYYWKEFPKDINEYEVLDKRFNEIKEIYILCFETLCRILVIAMGIEAISQNGTLMIPTKKKEIDIFEFEEMNNANKINISEKYDFSKLFIQFLDCNLRNGIGHHSAYYDAGSDEVVLIKQDGEQIISTNINYTKFCFDVMNSFSGLSYLSYYVYFMLTVSGGNLK